MAIKNQQLNTTDTKAINESLSGLNTAITDFNKKRNTNLPTFGQLDNPTKTNDPKKALVDRYKTGIDNLNNNPYFSQQGPSEAEIKDKYLQQANSTIQTIKSTFDKYIEEDKQAKRDLISKTYLTNLAGGLTASPMGGALETKAAEKGQEQVRKTTNERDALIAKALEDANVRASEEFLKQRENYLSSVKDRFVEENKIKEQVRNTALEELKLYAEARSFDEFAKEGGDSLVKQYMNETGLDETGLKAYFLNQGKANLLSDKPEILGDKAVFFQKRSDGTIGQISVQLPEGTQKIKEARLTDGGVQILYDNGTYRVIGTPGNNSSETPDAEVTAELQQAQNAIKLGANPDDVRRTFLDRFPKKGDLFLKYTKQEF